MSYAYPSPLPEVTHHDSAQPIPILAQLAKEPRMRNESDIQMKKRLESSGYEGFVFTPELLYHLTGDVREELATRPAHNKKNKSRAWQPNDAGRPRRTAKQWHQTVISRRLSDKYGISMTQYQKKAASNFWMFTPEDLKAPFIALEEEDKILRPASQTQGGNDDDDDEFLVEYDAAMQAGPAAENEQPSTRRLVAAARNERVEVRITNEMEERESCQWESYLQVPTPQPSPQKGGAGPSRPKGKSPARYTPYEAPTLASSASGSGSLYPTPAQDAQDAYPYISAPASDVLITPPPSGNFAPATIPHAVLSDAGVRSGASSSSAQSLPPANYADDPYPSPSPSTIISSVPSAFTHNHVCPATVPSGPAAHNIAAAPSIASSSSSRAAYPTPAPSAPCNAQLGHAAPSPSATSSAQLSIQHPRPKVAHDMESMLKFIAARSGLVPTHMCVPELDYRAAIAHLDPETRLKLEVLAAAAVKGIDRMLAAALDGSHRVGHDVQPMQIETGAMQEVVAGQPLGVPQQLYGGYPNATGDSAVNYGRLAPVVEHHQHTARQPARAPTQAYSGHVQIAASNGGAAHAVQNTPVACMPPAATHTVPVPVPPTPTRSRVAHTAQKRPTPVPQVTSAPPAPHAMPGAVAVRAPTTLPPPPPSTSALYARSSTARATPALAPADTQPARASSSTYAGPMPVIAHDISFDWATAPAGVPRREAVIAESPLVSPERHVQTLPAAGPEEPWWSQTASDGGVQSGEVADVFAGFAF